MIQDDEVHEIMKQDYLDLQALAKQEEEILKRIELSPLQLFQKKEA